MKFFSFLAAGVLLGASPLLADQFINLKKSLKNDTPYITSPLDEQLMLLHRQQKNRNVGYYIDARSNTIVGTNQGRIPHMPATTPKHASKKPKSKAIMAQKNSPTPAPISKKSAKEYRNSTEIPFEMRMEKIELMQ